MARQETAGELINTAALEIGLTPVPDPFATQDDSFSQLAGLLNAAGRELVTLFNWNELIRQFAFSTNDADADGYVDLPDDYDRFIQQTQWDTTEELPVIGPLDAQQWNYLLGRNLISDTIYLHWRVNQNRMELFPNPPPADRNIIVQYISRNWVQPDGGGARTDRAQTTSDLVLFDPILIVKFLILKYMNLKQLPAGAAALAFETAFMSRTGQNKGAPVLSAGRRVGGMPLLSPLANTPDTGFGGV